MNAKCPKCGHDDVRFRVSVMESGENRRIKMSCYNCQHDSEEVKPRQGHDWAAMFPDWHPYEPDYCI